MPTYNMKLPISVGLCANPNNKLLNKSARMELCLKHTPIKKPLNKISSIIGPEITVIKKIKNNGILEKIFSSPVWFVVEKWFSINKKIALINFTINISSKPRINGLTIKNEKFSLLNV